MDEAKGQAARRLFAIAVALLAWLVVPVFATLLGAGAAQAEGVGPGLAMHGAPDLAPAAPFLPYANPDAPKGGTLRQAVTGTFDSTNPFIVKGIAAVGIREFVYESLMKRSLDEPFTLYGLLAERAEMSADRTRIAFHLRANAHFSDGVPLTADDVAYTLDLLKREGRPNYREYYSKVTRIVRKGPRDITFFIDPKAQDRELPLILALMPVLPKHIYAKPGRFNRTTLAGPIGSGPYRVESVDPGRRIVYARDPHYWGQDLAVSRGFNNFDRLRFDYYRDESSVFEAFKAGLVDLRAEPDATRWATGYDIPALRKGLLRKVVRPTGAPAGLYALVFNVRRPIFADVRVRRALLQLFDFPQINRMLLEGAFARTVSYFDRSALAAKGPASAAERALLAPFPNAVSREIMEHGFAPPPGDSWSATRQNRRDALKLFAKAGYALHGGVLRRVATGEPFRFEILLVKPEEERIALAYADTLKALGIAVRIRTVDSSQYILRRQAFDFDMTTFRWDGTLSPGNEQRYRWGAVSADAPTSYNVAGIKNPAVDAMIDHVLKAQSRQGLVTATRALDRVLLAGAYVIPLYHLPADRVALRAGLGYPARPPLFGFDSLSVPLFWWQERPSARSRVFSPAAGG